MFSNSNVKSDEIWWIKCMRNQFELVNKVYEKPVWTDEFLACQLAICGKVHCHVGTTFCFWSNWEVYCVYFDSTGQVSWRNTRIYNFFFFEIVYKNNASGISKKYFHNLSCRWNCIRLLRNRFVRCCPLFWLLLCLRRIVVDPRLTNSNKLA